MRFVTLTNPEDRRTTFFREAHQRVLGCDPVVVSWLDFLGGAELPQADALRIESPGENLGVHEILIKRGADLIGVAGPGEVRPGSILDSGLWFRGFADALADLRRFEGAAMNSPTAITTMMDKRSTHQLFAQLDVPAPSLFTSVFSYEELQERRREGHHRLFLKPRYGSSASGVLAWQSKANRQEITTSVELTDDGLFNSLKIRRYTDEHSIARIVNALGQSELICEVWVPKATQNGLNFDLRVLAIRGHAPCHIVVRTSRSPMTNLHLGNQRGDLESVRRSVGAEWDAMCRTAEQLVNGIPGALYSGLDIAFDVTKRRHVVLEANAFGDLLPGILNNGQDTYEAELRAWVKSHSSTSET